MLRPESRDMEVEMDTDSMCSALLLLLALIMTPAMAVVLCSRLRASL